MTDLLGLMAHYPSWELSHFGFEGENEWRVHSVSGGRNDREWTLIGTGVTPADALAEAAQAIEARQRQDAKTGLARKGESAVGKADAPTL